jgi:hypothetical protein
MLPPPEDTPSGPGLMAGGGFYNRHGWMQAAGIKLALPALARAAAAVPVEEPVVVADYGCSQGRNSLRPMGVAIERLRARRPDVPISVVHVDQPANDFASLFAVLHESEEGYLRRHRQTYALAVGSSFFEQVLPPGSVALGWSSFAAQWLSRAPAEAAGYVSCYVTPQFAPPEVVTLVRTQAATDWRAFLAARGAELRPGGRLVVLVPAGPAKSGPASVAPLMRTAVAVLDRLVEQGVLDRRARARAFIPNLPRTSEDMRAPFAEGQFAGLELEGLEVQVSPDLAWERFRRDGNAAALADAYLAFFRATFQPSLLHSMAPFASPEERDRVADAIGEDLRRSLEADPKQCAEVPRTLIVLRRV